jgi:hypothetical protein
VKTFDMQEEYDNVHRRVGMQVIAKEMSTGRL